MKPFDIELDRGVRMLRTTLRGFWTPAVVEPYERALLPAFRTLAALPGDGPTRWFVDGLDYGVQDQSVMDAVAAMLLRAAPLHPDRTAVVVSSALQRLQVARRTAHDMVRYFASSDEAMDWLLAPDARDGGVKAA